MNPFKWLINKAYSNLFTDEIEQNTILINNLNQQISDLKIANEKLSIRKDIPQPAVLGTITLKDCYALLQPLCSDIYLSDEYFSLTSKDKALTFSEATKVQYVDWIANDHDCDNFSFALLGYWSDSLKSFAFGIAWSNTHAFNLMIDNNKQVWIVEPQSNKYYTLEEAKTNNLYFPLRMVIM